MQILGRFLGHDIVSFNDGTTHPIPVVEINSAGKIICRSYTGDTIADEDSEQEINRYFESENEKGILKEIAEQIGTKRFAISEDVLNFIDETCHPDESDFEDLSDDDLTLEHAKKQNHTSENNTTFKNEDYLATDSIPEDNYGDSDIDPYY